MTIISYSQNFEDVMLWRALKHVQNGRYIDIGAQHPTIDSVSKLFYDHGWRGIHIEPVPHYANLLREERPDETVLQIAIGAENGTLNLNVFPDTGLSTGIKEYAANHQRNFDYHFDRIQVPMLTLSSALEFIENESVHWLKIDVEGLEEDVLRGWDSKNFRPWIVVIETTVPTSENTRELPELERIFEHAGYRCAYFDGLNRFYIAQEHIELADTFRVPPNVFDAVQLSGLASSELCRKVIADGNKKTIEYLEKIATLESDLNETKKSLRSIEEESKERFDLTPHKLADFALELKRLGRDLVESKNQEISLISQNAQLREELSFVRLDVLKKEQKIDELEKEAKEWWSLANVLNQHVQAFEASTSWKITSPFRGIAKTIKASALASKHIASTPTSYLKRLARPTLSRAMRIVLSNPQLQAKAIKTLNKHPELKQRLWLFAVRAGIINQAQSRNTTTSAFLVETEDHNILLSQEANSIFLELKHAKEAGKV